MPSPQFEDFCNRLCNALGLAAPRLETRDGVPAAFSLAHKGVCMVVSEVSARAPSPAQVCLVVDFGDVPENQQAEVYPALLQANFMMLDAGAPAFGLHPVSGRITYQLTWGLDQADPLALCGALDGITDAVMQWREGRVLEPAAGAAHEPPAPSHALRA